MGANMKMQENKLEQANKFHEEQTKAKEHMNQSRINALTENTKEAITRTQKINTHINTQFQNIYNRVEDVEKALRTVHNNHTNTRDNTEQANEQKTTINQLKLDLQEMQNEITSLKRQYEHLKITKANTIPHDINQLNQHSPHTTKQWPSSAPQNHQPNSNNTQTNKRHMDQQTNTTRTGNRILTYQPPQEHGAAQGNHPTMHIPQTHMKTHITGAQRNSHLNKNATSLDTHTQNAGPPS